MTVNVKRNKLSLCTLCVERNLQRHRAVSLRQHDFLVYHIKDHITPVCYFFEDILITAITLWVCARKPQAELWGPSSADLECWRLASRRNLATSAGLTSRLKLAFLRLFRFQVQLIRVNNTACCLWKNVGYLYYSPYLPRNLLRNWQLIRRLVKIFFFLFRI